MKTCSLNNQPQRAINAARRCVPLVVRTKIAYLAAAQVLAKARAVTFDFNGVISNDEHIIKQAVMTVFAQRGFAFSHTEYTEEFLGHAWTEWIVRYLQKNGLDNSRATVQGMIQNLLSSYSAIVETSPLTEVAFPGAKEVIERLAPGRSLAIGSLFYRAQIETTLRRLGLAEVFNGRIVEMSQLSRGKPDPEVYLKSLEIHQLKPGELAVAIEDTAPGVLSAKAAGMFCIAVLQTSPYNKLRAAGADLIIENLAGLVKYLRKAI